MTTYLFTDLEWSPLRTINIFYDEDFDIPEEVQEEGLVLFYIQFDAPSTGWWPVPAAYVLVSGEAFSIGAAYGDAAIAFLLRNPDGSAIPAAQQVIDVAVLRVIVVPPGTVLTGNMVPNDLIGMSYDEVTVALGIRE